MCASPVRDVVIRVHAGPWVLWAEGLHDSRHVVGCDGYSFRFVCWLWLGQKRRLPFLLRCVMWKEVG